MVGCQAAHVSAVLGRGLGAMAEEDSHGNGMWVVKPPGHGAPLPSPSVGCAGFIWLRKAARSCGGVAYVPIHTHTFLTALDLLLLLLLPYFLAFEILVYFANSKHPHRCKLGLSASQEMITLE